MAYPNADDILPRILVIEDDQAVKKMLRLALRNAGFEVSEATTGREALESLGRQPPDGVVLDLGLPDGAAGKVLQWLRRQDQTSDHALAWVVISATDREEVVERYGPLGGRFIPKPFDPWALVGTLEQLLLERGTALA